MLNLLDNKRSLLSCLFCREQSIADLQITTSRQVWKNLIFSANELIRWNTDVKNSYLFKEDSFHPNPLFVALSYLKCYDFCWINMCLLVWKMSWIWCRNVRVLFLHCTGCLESVMPFPPMLEAAIKGCFWLIFCHNLKNW